MKNRIPIFVASVITVLAAIGIIGMLIANPTGFLQRIAVIILIGVAIYFIARRFFIANPQNKDQRAFLKAAKQSKKRLNHKSSDNSSQRLSVGSLTSLKKSSKPKKNPAHLTVIEGKKSKKKNRVSF